MNDKKELLNILLVSLDEKLCKDVSSTLASNLDMYFADCKELIEYDLIDRKDVIDKCGIEYMKKRECGVIKNCSQYSNTVLSLNYILFSEYYMYFNNSLIIYLKLKEEEVTSTVNKISYENYDDKLEEKVDITIDLENFSQDIVCEKIIDKIGEYYENSR